MDADAEDDAERSANREALYKPPKGEHPEASSQRRPGRMTAEQAKLLALEMAAEDAQLQRPGR